tara:strand:- start:280 stop:786 length:507 start_codon:yes stop_codon:yes gene_type:complete
MEQTIKTASEKRAIQRANRQANMTPEEKQLQLEKRRNKRNELNAYNRILANVASKTPEEKKQTASEKRAIQRANMTPEEKQLHLEKRRNKRNETPQTEENKMKAKERSQQWRDENPLNAEQKENATQRAKKYAERKKDFEFINELCPCCNLREGGHTLGQAVECGLEK